MCSGATTRGMRMAQDGDPLSPALISAMYAGCPTAGTSSNSPSPPDTEFETDTQRERSFQQGQATICSGGTP